MRHSNRNESSNIQNQDSSEKSSSGIDLLTTMISFIAIQI